MVEPIHPVEALDSTPPLILRNDPRWNSYVECPIPYEDGELLVSSHQSNWKGTHVCVYRLFQDTVPRPVFGQHDAIVLHMHSAVKLQRHFEGAWKQGVSVPGSLCINPKEIATTYKWTGSPICAAISIEPSIFSGLIHEFGSTDPARVEIIGNFNFHNPSIEQICRNLVNEVQTSELGGQILVEILGQALGLLLLRKYSTLTVIRDLPLQKLKAAQLKCIDDYIHAHMEKGITLAELAASINLSPSYFANLFKYSTGVPPHQYIIKCRVEKAKLLLLEGKLTIAEVARRVGFTDQSHLTHHCKRLLGVTPKIILLDSKNLQNPH